MNQQGTIWGREPVAIVTTVMLVVAVLATYGLNLVPDPDKFATALVAVLTLIAGGAVSRSQVSSPATVAKLTAKLQAAQDAVYQQPTAAPAYVAPPLAPQAEPRTTKSK